MGGSEAEIGGALAPGPDFIYTNFSGGRGLDFIYTKMILYTQTVRGRRGAMLPKIANLLQENASTGSIVSHISRQDSNTVTD